MRKQQQLAYFGGNPIRRKPSKSMPYVTEEMKNRVKNLMDQGRFSKFVGSPISNTVENLGLSSKSIKDIKHSEKSYFGGPSIRSLEALWSDIHKTKYSISVNSGTSGLTSALMAAGIGPGDEVIISPFSFTASATSIIAANAIPVFADINLNTFCLSAEKAEKAISSSTRAIMPIHWNSNAGDLSSIISLARSNNFKVIEDAAQSPGSIYENKFLGTHGDLGVFSLNEPKNIMTGEGGIIVTDQEEFAIKSRLIRNHGEAIVDESFSEDMIENIIGFNFRLPEILAELGLAQAEKLSFLNNIRRDNYLYLSKQLVLLAGEYLIPQRITNLDSYYPYTAGFRWLSGKSGIHRNLIANVLRAEGITVSCGVSRLMSEHPMFKKRIAYGKGNCPFSCHLYDQREKYTVSDLPNSNQLNNEEYLGFFQIGWPNEKKDMDDIVHAFNKILSNKNSLKNAPRASEDKGFISAT